MSNNDDAGAAVVLRRPRRVLAGSSGRLRIVAADGEKLYLKGLERRIRAWPEFELVGLAEGPEVLETIAVVRPRVLVADHTELGVDRDELIAGSGEQTRVLLMCTRPTPPEIYDAIAAGAGGFLTKNCSKQELCHAIAAVGRGDAIAGSSVLPALGREIRLREAAPADILTEREREILLLMCEGLSAPAIAERMNLSLSTVKTHQAHLFEKLGANERAMAVARAFRRRLIE